MELTEWEKRELEKIRLANLDLYTVYYDSVEPKERKDILDRIIEKDGMTEEVTIMKEMHEHRYISREKGVTKIDYAIRGWVNIGFLAEMNRSRFSRKKLPKKIEEILADLGKNIADKYGSKGQDIWYKELVNVCKVYIHLCKTDKSYGSIIFGIGRMKEHKLLRKICFDMVNISHTIPMELGTDAFDMLARASREAFYELYPKTENLYDLMIDKADGKQTTLAEEDDD